jgi:hypothetical protein
VWIILAQVFSKEDTKSMKVGVELSELSEPFVSFVLFVVHKQSEWGALSTQKPEEPYIEGV